MFYSQFILARKGPLGTIWIAAHLERKLRKNQVADTDIGVSVDSILFPDVPIALRLSSHLLLGVVRIYSRKVNYLFDDCSETLLKVKQAFRSTAVDLPPEESTAPYHSITLPETFDLDDFELPDSDIIFQGNYVDHHVSTREQITLQDTMEGVVYSTTQFGLDERFGDGDASGLDLDEELFLNKVTTPGHVGSTMVTDSDFRDEPHASAHQMASLEQGLDNEVIDGNTELEELDEKADTMDYAQASFTPGLVEEPNLSIAQETSVCDDHLELGEKPNCSDFTVAETCEDHQYSEDHNTTKLSAKETLTSATSNSDHYFGHLSNDVNSATVLNDQKINQLYSLANESPSAAGPPFLDELVEAATSPASEYLTGDLSAKRNGNGREKLHNGYVYVDDRGSFLVHEPHEVGIDPQRIELGETDGCPSVSCDLKDSFGNSDDAGILEKSLSGMNFQNSELQACKDQNDLKISCSIDHEKVEVADMHVLQPCKHLNQPGAAIPKGHQPGSPTEIQGLDQNHITEHAPCEEFQPDFGKLNEQIEKLSPIEARSNNLIGNENSELPAPEKLLSVSGGHVDESDHLLESTPNREDSVIGDVDDAGINIVSGKKRSLTESTLTVDSVNSIESFGVVQSKRTKESIPDDNDLLSSILVGRRSSIFKMKPSPHLPTETTCKKRTRSTTRLSSSKRKVLVDDIMVLHGDQIRQQLTNTEDIRRVRKKAPCTRPEIWMIRKEFLDEEIFAEPMFTGFSSDLISLYDQTYDLSEIKLTQNETWSNLQETAGDRDMVDGHLQVCNYMPGCANVNLDRVTEKDGNYESVLFRCVAEVEPTEGQQGESPVLPSKVYHGEKVQGDVSSDVLEPHGLLYEHSVETSETHFDGDTREFADGLRSSISNGVEPSFSNDLILVHKLDNPTASVDTQVLLEQCRGNDGGIQSDACGGDLTSESQIIEMDMVNFSSRKVVDAINTLTEDGAGGAGNGIMETRPSNDFLLEVTEGVVSVENMLTANMHTEERDPFLLISPAIDRSDNLNYFTADKGTEGSDKDGLGFVNEVENAELNLYDTCHFRHNYGVEEGSIHHVEEPNSGAKIAFVDHPSVVDHSDFAYDIDGHDTGFLNEDDDGITEEGEDCTPSAENISFTDNSGWSSRTRAVAKYLQVLFDKEAEQEKRALPMNNLLIGKTRKEASRMFFEALVLKTRDYIHVEQNAPFENIKMKPRMKLMKADF